MKRFSAWTYVLTLALVSAACSDDESIVSPIAPGPQALAPAAAGGGGHLVSFKKGVPGDFAARVEAAGGTVLYVSHGLGVAAVDGLDAAGAASLAGSAGVAAIADTPILSLDLPTSVSTPDAAGGSVESPAAPQTAFFYPRQWHLRAISANLAWAAGRLGSPSVDIAILDTGLSYTHADLNGRVDLSRSASFVPSDDALVAAFFPGFHPVTDLHYHGTHVGATVSSNALAAAGVTSRTTLIGVKVCNVNGSCPGAAVFAGIAYAVDQGADIANMSLGGGFNKSDFPGFVSQINRLFNYANQRGTTFVVSAGNESIDLQHSGDLFKTYCDAPNVVCVSATGPTAQAGTNGPWTNVDAFASYSNFGRSAISVAAPGGNASAVWAACSRTSLQIPICQTGTFIVGLAGTSMASPHTAGVAALIAEDVGRNPGQIRSRLHQTADDLGQTGTDPFYGKGRINAATAVGL